MSLFALSGLLVFITSTAMSVALFIKAPKNPIAKFWGIFCISVAIWGIGGCVAGGADNATKGLFYWRLSYIGVTAVPVLFYHFVLKFTENRKTAELKSHYFITALFEILNWTSFMNQEVTRISPDTFYQTKSGWAYHLFFLYFAIMVVLAHYHLWIFLIRSNSQTKRNQIKWFFAATAIGFTGGLTCFFPGLGWKLYPYGNFAVVLYPLIMSYAILKHQLMDIRIVIQKTFFYAFWTLMLSVFYALTIVLIQALILGGNFSGSDEWNSYEIRLYHWSGLLALLINVGLATFVWVRNSKSILCRKFCLLSIFIGFWASGSWFVNVIPDQNEALIILKLNYAFGVFVPVLFLGFIRTLIGKTDKSWLIGLGYIFSGVLAASLFATPYFIQGLNLITNYDFYISRPGAIYRFFVVYFCIYFLIAFAELISYIRQSEGEKVSQLWYVFLAYVIGMAAGCEYFLSVYGILKRPPLDDYILAVTFGILTYAISKHSLMDIKMAVRKTAFYSLLAFTISTVYVFIVFVAHKLFIGDVFTRQHLVASLVLILFITLLLRPAESFLRKRLDKRFFKGTIEEISEQKALLETELERRERLKSVGILAAGMAHEIKNPITAIRTFAEFLPKKYEDPEFREKFSKLLIEETDRISGIIRDLLLFARPGEPVMRPCNVGKILISITDLLKADILKYSIELELDLVPNLMCFADPLQIKQAFLNIIMNAIDALKIKQGLKRLIISIHNLNDYIEIIIKDTGIGISPEKLPHLFDPFYTNKEGGTGLGLAITHSIIHKNDGKIEVQSILSHETIFSIVLLKA